MRKLFIFFILMNYSSEVLCQKTSKSWSGSINDFVEIRIHCGGGLYGAYSLNLFREGLIYRESGVDSLNEFYENVKLIPLLELDRKKIIKLQDLLTKYDVLNLEPQKAPENYFSFHNTTSINFTDASSNYNRFLYTYCDKRIDEIINLLNELIPKQDRERFHMITKCK